MGLRLGLKRGLTVDLGSFPMPGGGTPVLGGIADTFSGGPLMNLGSFVMHTTCFQMLLRSCVMRRFRMAP